MTVQSNCYPTNESREEEKTIVDRTKEEKNAKQWERENVCTISCEIMQEQWFFLTFLGSDLFSTILRYVQLLRI